METLEQRAGRWRKEVKESDCECSEEHLAEFARAELLRAAEIAKREQRHWAGPETETALLNVEGDIRKLAE
jgi:hypothetical protein